MSSSDKTANNGEKVETVRVQVCGASCAVNAIQDQKTDRGISLICPFPALEVDIPILFSTPGDDEMQTGTIHRISVEDDAVTSLPKLRLSIRAKGKRSTVISPTPRTLIEESRQSTAAKADSKDSAEGEDLDSDEDDLFVNAMKSVADDSPFNAESRADADDRKVVKNETRFMGDLEEDTFDDEPAWVACQDFPLPGDILEHAKANRSRKITNAVAWMTVAGLLGIGGYWLVKSGLIDTSGISDYLAAFRLTEKDPAPAARARTQPYEMMPSSMVPPVVIEDSPKAMIAQIEPPEPVPTTVLPAELAPADPGADELETASNHPDDGRGAPRAAVSQAGADADAKLIPVEAAEKVADSATEAPTAQAQDETEYEEVVLILPTRWPAEYATAYRLRDPQGVVVDVPGGLVKNEGWLDLRIEHPMIRSVKAIQRETGARFMVLINGDPPRFMTMPKTGGVALRLFRKPQDAEKPSQIALLEK